MTFFALFLTSLAVLTPFTSNSIKATPTQPTVETVKVETKESPVVPAMTEATSSNKNANTIEQLPIDLQERNNPNYNKFTLNSRRGITEYIYVDGTYYPQTYIGNTLPAGGYQLDVQYKAHEVTGRGLWFTLVCTSSCTKLDGSGTVGPNEILYMLNTSYLGTGEKHVRGRFTINQDMVNNTVVRVFANDGTNVDLDFVKFQRLVGNNAIDLLKNTSFQTQVDTQLNRISKDSLVSPSEIMPSYRDWTGDNFRAAFESVIPTVYGATNVLMVNWPHGPHETSDFVQSKAFYPLAADKQYRFEMRYFAPQHSINLANNYFKVQLYNENIPSTPQYPIQANLVQETCDYTATNDCEFKTFTQDFSPHTSAFYMMQLYTDTRMELFVDKVTVRNLTDNTIVWEDTFDSYTAHDIRIKTPNDWVFREPWKRAYGMSPR